MKIKGKELVKFLKKVSLYGTSDVIDNVKLNFEQDKVTCLSVSATNTVMVRGILFSKSFIEYEAIGEVVLQNMDRIIKIVSGHEDDLQLKFEGNLLTIVMGKRKIETELMSPTVYKGADKFPELKSENSQIFGFDIGVLKNLIGDMSINQEFSIYLETYSNGLQVSNDGTFKFTEKYDLDVQLSEAKTKFGEPLICGIKNLEGNVTIKLGTDYPVLISETLSELSDVSVIVAPRVEKE